MSENIITNDAVTLATVANQAKRVDAYAAPYTVLPHGFSVESLEDTLIHPARHKGCVSMLTVDSFVKYVKRNGPTASTVLYATLHAQRQELEINAVLNDHNDVNDSPGWKDFRAHYCPVKTVEWKTWTNNNKQTMGQVEFATFLEDNLADIAGVENMPTGQQMLEMAMNFEATSDKKFKNKVNLQGGGVNLVYVDEDNAQTQQVMKLFERFTIGIPVFEGEHARYPMVARLKYRQKEGKLVFWYELVRPDLVFKAAADSQLEYLAEHLADYPLLHARF